MTYVLSSYGQRSNLLNGTGVECFVEILDTDTGNSLPLIVTDDQLREVIGLVEAPDEEDVEEPDYGDVEEPMPPTDEPQPAAGHPDEF